MNPATSAPAAKAAEKDTVSLFFGLLLGGLGLMVMVGWLTATPALVQPIPGTLNMRFNTALCFFLSGILFLLNGVRPARLTLSLMGLATTILFALPALVLVQHIYQVDLGIDWVALHHRIPDSNEHPGRMSPVGCASMMMVSLSFMVLMHARMMDKKPSLVALPASLVFLLGMASMLNQLLQLSAQYEIARYNVVALHTALGLCVAGIGLWAVSRYSLSSRLTATERAIRDTNDRLSRVVSAQRMIAQSEMDLDNVLQTIVEQLMALTRASGTAVELIDGDNLVYRATTGRLEQFKHFSLPMKNSLSGICIAAREIITCSDTEKDARVNKDATRKLGIRSMIVAPLSNNDRVIGVLKASADVAGAFGENQEQIVSLMSGLIGAAIARQQDIDAKQQAIVSLEQAQAKLTYMAQYDHLTGLPNRALFMDRMATALHRMARSKKSMALMFLDLDGFKLVNDTLGHAVGDALLKAFAVRMAGVIRRTDTLSRLGGDEFTIILEEIADPAADLEKIAAKIMAAMGAPLNALGHSLSLTTSVGIYVVKQGGSSVDEVINAADHEMYKAKKAGKNRFSIAAQ